MSLIGQELLDQANGENGPGNSNPKEEPCQ
jgi:hypothetical protein